MMAQYNAANNTSIIKAGTPRRIPRPLSSLYGATPRRRRRAPLPWRDDLPADHQYADLLAGQAAGHVAGDVRARRSSLDLAYAGGCGLRVFPTQRARRAGARPCTIRPGPPRASAAG